MPRVFDRYFLGLRLIDLVAVVFLVCCEMFVEVTVDDAAESGSSIFLTVSNTTDGLAGGAVIRRSFPSHPSAFSLGVCLLPSSCRACSETLSFIDEKAPITLGLDDSTLIRCFVNIPLRSPNDS